MTVIFYFPLCHFQPFSQTMWLHLRFQVKSCMIFRVSSSFFTFVWGTGHWTEGLMHAKQTLYYWIVIPAPYPTILLILRSLKIVQVSLGLACDPPVSVCREVGTTSLYHQALGHFQSIPIHWNIFKVSSDVIYMEWIKSLVNVYCQHERGLVKNLIVSDP